MRIIQSFWSGGVNADLGLNNKAGWLSAEYHWMSWALSCLQFSKFYGGVHLVTDAVGKHLLIDTLQLPYQEVSVELDVLNVYSPKLWALGKIYTYSIQQTPFIHVDGDIYIWDKLPMKFNQAELLGQNIEIDFSYYYKSIAEVQEYFEFIPEAITKYLTENKIIESCNTGIIGGHNLLFFKEYITQSLAFVNKNIHLLENIDMATFNITFEQLLYFSLAKQHNVPITYLIERDENFDATYKGFARFECVPYQTKFIHALGEFKRTPETCQHLAKRLRKDYPAYYYHILRKCQVSGVSLHNKAYYLTALSPEIHTNEYYTHLSTHYQDFYVADTVDNWVYFYGKDMANYIMVEVLFSLTREELLNQTIIFDKDAEIIEEEDTILKQWLKVANIQSLIYEEYELDSLDMILYDVFSEQKTITKGIDELSLYFSKEEIESDYLKFQNLVLDRIKNGLYLGGLRYK